MKISVANPIYDSVFKFLMDDERIAKTVLSACLLYTSVARNLFARDIQIVEGKGWKTVNEILLRQIACEDCADIAQRQRQEALLSFASSIGNKGCGLDIEI